MGESPLGPQSPMELWERKERVGAKENRVARTMSAHCHHCYTNFLAIFAGRCVYVSQACRWHVAGRGVCHCQARLLDASTCDFAPYCHQTSRSVEPQTEGASVPEWLCNPLTNSEWPCMWKINFHHVRSLTFRGLPLAFISITCLIDDKITWLL